MKFIALEMNELLIFLDFSSLSLRGYDVNGLVHAAHDIFFSPTAEIGEIMHV